VNVKVLRSGMRCTESGELVSLSRAAADPTFTAAQSLLLLVTMESLLFAALNVGLVLAAPVAGGRNISRRGAYRLAKFAVASLALVAAAAVLAWWQVFVDHWPQSDLRKVQAAGALVGICIQPFVSAVAAYGIKP
jgi:hypothetical protein